MTILVTRPSPAGEMLVNRLRTLGRVAFHSPLIEFAPGNQLAMLPNLLSSLNQQDLVFVLSQHAVNWPAVSSCQQSPGYLSAGG